MADSERRGRARATALVPAVVALGLIVLVWAATTGPVAIFGSSGRRVAPPTYSPSSDPSTGPPGAGSGRALFRDVPQKYDLHWLGDLLVWSLFLFLALAVALALRWMWTNRWHPPAKPETAEFDVLPDMRAVSEALTRDAGAQLAAVAQGSPRNGIVQCWLRLEDAIAVAGLPREPWETAGEYTVRVLRRLDIDPRSIGTLARLYREARFSAHELDDEARTAARSALQQLHSDLQELGVPLPPGGGR